MTLTSTAESAADLGYLLHKHPDRAQSFDLPVGRAHVFYPEVEERRCTVALLLEVDPIDLVRSGRHGEGTALAQYVNDRPYAASSMLAVALGRVFRTALSGRCTARPDLAGRPLPLAIHLPAVPSTGGAALVHRMLEPLGWQVATTTHALDPAVPAWGDSRYVDVRLSGTMPLDAALSHLYVLLPVLDDAKHYWVSTDEVDKLVRAGAGWLGEHPERELITARYLAHQRSYVADATDRLAALDEAPGDAGLTEVGTGAGTARGATGTTTGTPPGTTTGTATGTATGTTTGTPADPPWDVHPPPAEPRTALVHARRAAVLAELRAAGATRVVDLGCGEGALLRDLLDDVRFTQVVGVDVSARALDRAARRLGLDRMADTQRARLTLWQSSVTYRDDRLAGFDAVVLMEVIEHLDPQRLPDLASNVLGAARPRTVVVTTPNAEHNVRYERLAAGTMRHTDHRFEWSRAELLDWAARVGEQYGYAGRWEPVGEVDPEVGPPTQMVVLSRLHGDAA